MTVTDFHSHILPSLDHGCSGIEECHAQLKIMSDAGTTVAVATPHFYPHVHKSEAFRENTDLALSKISSQNLSCAPSLCVGAEVLLCEGLENMEALPLLCIRGTKVLLLELPTHRLKNGHFDTVEAILSNGYTVLLAHIDRYLKDNQDDIDTLLSMGALAQINADALLSHSSLKKITKYLERTDSICAIGSDLHGARVSDYNAFLKAQRILKEHYETVMQRSDKLLADAEKFRFT